MAHATITGTERIKDAVKRLDVQMDRHLEDVPREFSNSVKRKIVETGSIDTGRMVSSVDYFEQVMDAGDHRHFEVGTQQDDMVTYDGFVDQPGETRDWAGRFFYRQGIEAANIKPIFDSILDHAFVV